MPAISTVGTSSRPSSLPCMSSSSSYSLLSTISPSHYLRILSFLRFSSMPSSQTEKENARLGNSKDKNGNAAPNTNATHVNPGPRQQSALDMMLAETGAQCRINHSKDDKEFSYPRRGLTEPNDMAKSTMEPKRSQRIKPRTPMLSPYAGELRLPLFPGKSGRSPLV